MISGIVQAFAIDTLSTQGENRSGRGISEQKAYRGIGGLTPTKHRREYKP